MKLQTNNITSIRKLNGPGSIRFPWFRDGEPTIHRQFYIDKHKIIPLDRFFIGNPDKIKHLMENDIDSIVTQHCDEDDTYTLFLIDEDDAIYLSTRTSSSKCHCLVLYGHHCDLVNKIIDELSDNAEPPRHIKIVAQNSSGFYLEKSEIDTNVDIDFSLNYNSDFEPIHKIIFENCINYNRGLILLHGLPGTGKSTYLRWLVNNVERDVVFISPRLVTTLDSPQFMSFLLRLKNCILIIEDADGLVKKRVGNPSDSGVSTILNITDGLLGDALNIQIIATFNMDISDIDPALLRKGRLTAKYEFNPLEHDRAIKLAHKLGVELKPDETNLCDIYNSNKIGFIKKKNTIGFKI